MRQGRRMTEGGWRGDGGSALEPQRMTIEFLADYPQHVPVLAEWLFEQWGRRIPGATVEGTVALLSARTNRDHMPISFVALEGGHPAGSASLIEWDMDTRKQLAPWMASVYVDRPFRNRGIGSALVSHVLKCSRNIGFGAVYLWTPDKQDFYKGCGWHTVEPVRYRNMAVTIMTASSESGSYCL